MREKVSGVTITIAPTIAIAMALAAAALSTAVTRTEAQAQAPAAAAPKPAAELKTPWGEPDLQGIWTAETDTPLQRPARFANQEVFTPEQRAQLDEIRTAVLDRDNRGDRKSEEDVASGYNSSFWSFKRTGARTSLLVDPPNGRLPPQTPGAQKMAATERAFRLPMLRSTETCKLKMPTCNGGTYDPTPAPQLSAPAPRYNTGRMNRTDDVEDANLFERCLPGGIPEFGAPTGSFRRIVQTPGGIAMFYDVGQGQGWQRNIIMDGRPHLPAGIRQWFGDSRGHWEGRTLVIDVTNFSPKTDFFGSRENLHVVERWTRTGLETIEYVITAEDSGVWTARWTARQEFTRQSNRDNRLYTEPRCIEGNIGLPAQLYARRFEEAAFAAGRGPDPATKDSTHGSFVLDEDPLR
jgi:hypothetical protein